MGLATIDPHSHKVQTKLYKIPKFGVNRPNSNQDTASWKCQNLQRNVWPSGRCSDCKFCRFQIAVSQSKLAWLTPNLRILWISVCSIWLCGSIVANPIIYRLVPSPSRFEIRQCRGYDNEADTLAGADPGLFMVWGRGWHLPLGCRVNGACPPNISIWGLEPYWNCYTRNANNATK